MFRPITWSLSSRTYQVVRGKVLLFITNNRFCTVYDIDTTSVIKEFGNKCSRMIKHIELNKARKELIVVYYESRDFTEEED